MYLFSLAIISLRFSLYQHALYFIHCILFFIDFLIHVFQFSTFFNRWNLSTLLWWYPRWRYGFIKNHLNRDSFGVFTLLLFTLYWCIIESLKKTDVSNSRGKIFATYPVYTLKVCFLKMWKLSIKEILSCCTLLSVQHIHLPPNRGSNSSPTQNSNC